MLPWVAVVDGVPKVREHRGFVRLLELIWWRLDAGKPHQARGAAVLRDSVSFLTSRRFFGHRGSLRPAFSSIVGVKALTLEAEGAG